MTFKSIWQSYTPQEKRALAAYLGKSVNQLSNIANGHDQAGPKLAIAISEASRYVSRGHVVALNALRPDLWD